MSRTKLKIIAACSMIIDHLAAIVLYDIISPELYYIMRFIGRYAMPIFCLLLVDGFFHTSDRGMYIWRTFLFAVISEIPFHLSTSGSALDFSYNNVMWTLLLGLVFMQLSEKQNENRIIAMEVKKRCITYNERKTLQRKSIFASMIILILVCVVSYILKSDYNVCGVILIASFYAKKRLELYSEESECIALQYGITIAATAILVSMSAWYTWLVYPLLLTYNGKKGKMWLKMMWYWFYPIHLLLFYLIRQYIVTLK